MTSAQHQDWINRGRPDEGLAHPLVQLENILTAHGYTVFDKPDARHLDDEPPEDHTDYSETGWPNGNTKWKRWAIDIMPPSVGQKSKVDGLTLPSLQSLGAQLRNDRDDNHPGVRWLKYMNYGPTGNNSAVHVSWYGNVVKGTQSSSSDAGHIHASARTDMWDYDTGGYDPVARMRGTGNDMDFTQGQKLDAIYNLTDPVQLNVGEAAVFHSPLVLMLRSLRSDLDALKLGAGVVSLSDAQLSAMASSISATVVDHLTATGPDATDSLPAVVESAFRDVLRNGVGQ